jgi:hypothetical protein
MNAVLSCLRIELAEDSFVAKVDLEGALTRLGRNLECPKVHQSLSPMARQALMDTCFTSAFG